jgi:hypothetical protein
MRHMSLLVLVVIGHLCFAGALLRAQDRETKVRQDREQFKNNERWIYNRLDKGLEEAKKSGKPLLVVFRCIPCEACSQFDKQVIEEQSGISKVLDKFVCVRIVQGNSMDLKLFQFDYDQSFHAILMNANQVIYGRFGTRSARPEEEDMTLEGFRAALEKALEWHAEGAALLGPRDPSEWNFMAKRIPEMTVDIPEQFPSLKGKYKSTLDYEGNVVQSCIHCHQIRDAQRMVFRSQGARIPDQVLFPYPLPDAIGLRMNPDTCATIAAVEHDSPSAHAGLRAGDEIERLDGQLILSTADIQWVLHNLQTQIVEVELDRKGVKQTLSLELPEGWRTDCDISFRPTTWELRRMATGGLVLKDAQNERREDLKISNDKLALRVDYVGQYGEHALGKNAGFQEGDVITSVDGKQDRMTEGQFMRYALSRPVGTKLKLKVRRGDDELPFSFATQ